MQPPLTASPAAAPQRPLLPAALLAAALLAPGPSHAQNAEVNQRLLDQQSRIDKGVASGQLGARATRQLNARDAHVAAQEQRMSARDHGKPLTAQQDARLNHELNTASAHIHTQRAKP